MTRIRTSCALLAAVAVLAGCPAAPPPAPPTATAKPTAIKPGSTPKTVAKTSVSGSAVAPAGMVAAGGGNILSHNGGVMVAAGAGNMVAAGAGNMVAAGAGNYRLQATEQKAIANTTVYLTDGEGKLVEGVKAVDTDANGKFKLEGVPAEGTFLLHVRANKADGTPTTLVTMVNPGEGKAADVSTETTCVAVALFGEGGSRKLTGLNLTAFDAAVAAMVPLVAARNAPDLTDRAAIRTWMDKLSGEIAALKVAMDGMFLLLGELKAGVDALNVKTDDLKSGVDALNDKFDGFLGGFGATPAPSATPAATPAPPKAFTAKAQWALRGAIAAITAGDTADRRFVIAQRGLAGAPLLNDDGPPDGGFQVQLAAEPAAGTVFDVYAAPDKGDPVPAEIAKGAGNLIGAITYAGGASASFAKTGDPPVTLPQVFIVPFFRVETNLLQRRTLTWRGDDPKPTGPVTLRFEPDMGEANWSSENLAFEQTIDGGHGNLWTKTWDAIELPARFKVYAKWGVNDQPAGELRVYVRHNRDEVNAAFDLAAKKNWDLKDAM